VAVVAVIRTSGTTDLPQALEASEVEVTAASTQTASTLSTDLAAAVAAAVADPPRRASRRSIPVVVVVMVS
jgi:hypothetical protein